MRDTKPMFSSRASLSSTPQRTAMPAADSRASPCPATCGLGSDIATTTRATPALDQRVGARRRAAVMAAGFQRHIDGCATRRFAGCLQRVHLGVRFAGTLVPALADHPAVAHDDAADPRIGRGRPQSPRGEPERTRHEFVVGGAEHGHRQLSISGRDG
jgi:hypothetical protein